MDARYPNRNAVNTDQFWEALKMSKVLFEKSVKSVIKLVSEQNQRELQCLKNKSNVNLKDDADLKKYFAASKIQMDDKL